MSCRPAIGPIPLPADGRWKIAKRPHIASARAAQKLTIQAVTANEVAMPIYAYKCSSCGHEKDVLQKVTDAPLSGCPACGAASFAKQITAAGFQLKGNGWYATDFKNGSAATPNGKPTDTAQPAAAEPKVPAEVAKSAPAAACGSGGCAACS
jgi:putative FmdB family regulatory protein